MSRSLAAALLLSTAVLSVGPTAAQEKTNGPAGACTGLAVALFERRFPEEVQRYAFEGDMLKPFLQLWHEKRRPDLPVLPESVTVYSLPDQPYLVGYQSRGCLIAFLAVERQNLWRRLRPHLGWQA